MNFIYCMYLFLCFVCFYVLCSVFYVYVSLAYVKVMSVSAVIGPDILLSIHTVCIMSLYVLYVLCVLNKLINR